MLPLCSALLRFSPSRVSPGARRTLIGVVSKMTYQDEDIRGSVGIAVLGNLRRQTTHAFRHLRAWRRRRARRIALGGIERVARGEIKELRRLLIRSGVSCEEVSQATPMLLRCLVKRQRVMAKYAGRSGFGLFVLLALQMAYIYHFQIPNGRLEHINDATIIIMLLIGAMICKLSVTRVRHFERALRYDPKFSERLALRYIWIVLLLLGIFGIKFSPTYTILVNTTWQDWLVALVQVTVLVLFFWLTVSLLAIRVLTRREPELVLVRALADAFEIIAKGGPASWRGISRRSRAARYINKAGSTLEGPIARKFGRWAGRSGGAEKPGAATIQERFVNAGLALRSKIAWLATPRPDTRDFLSRALGRQLIIAASGDLDRLEYADFKSADLPSDSRLTRLRRTLSWAAITFAPFIILVVSWWKNWLTDAMKVVLPPFSLLWLLVTVDPTAYKERIDSVIGTGKTLFGWK
jgi:hypothetical protein